MNSRPDPFDDDFEAAEYIPTSVGTIHHNPSSESYRMVHDWDDEKTLSERILILIGNASGQSKNTLPPLYKKFDPEALNMLFRPTSSSNRRHGGQLLFRYAGLFVTVEADGTITAETPESHNPPSKQ